MDATIPICSGLLCSTAVWHFSNKARDYYVAVDLKKRGVSVATGTLSNGVQWTSGSGKNKCYHFAFRLVFAAVDNNGVKKTVTVEKMEVTYDLFAKFNGGVHSCISVTHLTEDLRVFQLTEHCDYYAQHSSAFACIKPTAFELLLATAVAILWILMFSFMGWTRVEFGVFFAVLAASTCANFLWQLCLRVNVLQPRRDVVVTDFSDATEVPTQPVSGLRQPTLHFRQRMG